MSRHVNRDPTEFFSVVGAPYVRDRTGQERPVHELRAQASRPRLFVIGVATLSAAFCAVALAVPLLADTGAIRLVQLAYQAVR